MSAQAIPTELERMGIPDISNVESVQALVPILRPVMKAITAAVGKDCEVVLHDLSTDDFEHTILAIENPHVTGREVGGPSTNLGLQVMQSEHQSSDEFGYRAITSDGRELRCSSVYFRNSAGRVIAALCVNVDLTKFQSIKNTVENFLDFPGKTKQNEIFAPDIASVLDGMISDAIEHVSVPVPMMEKPDRLRVFDTLEQRGAFIVKRSVEKVANRLGISRVTAYAYLDELRGRR